MFNRGNRKLIPEERGGIIALYQANIPLIRIARDHMFCDVKTVRHWVRRYEMEGNLDRKVGSGRPRITTPEEDLRIFDAVAAKPITTTQEIAGNF